MAYTNPSGAAAYTYSDTTQVLSGALITKDGYQGLSPYASNLTVQGAGVSGNELILSSGGSLTILQQAQVTGVNISGGWLMVSGASVTDLTANATSLQTTKLDFSGGVIVSGFSGGGAGTMDMYTRAGAKIYNLNMTYTGAGAYFHHRGYLSGGEFSGRVLNIRDGAVVEDITVNYTYDAVQLFVGTFSGGTIAAGAKLVLNNAKSVVRDTIVSGGTVRMGIGQASGVTIAGGGVWNISGGTMNNTTVSSGGRLMVSSGQTFNATIASGGVLTVDTTSKTTSGATTMMHGEADGVIVQSGGTLGFTGGTWAWGPDNWAFASNVTVQSGGTVNMANFVRLLDITVASGGVLKRASNRTGFGGANTNIAKGTISNNGFGEDFEVVDGVATGLYLTGDGTTVYSCGDFQSGLTIRSGSVVSGASTYLYEGVTVDGLKVYGARGTTSAMLWGSGITARNLEIGSGGSVNLYSTATVDNSILSGGLLTLSSGVTANDLTVVSGAGLRGGLYVSKGATANNVTLGSKGIMYVRGGGVVNNLVVNDANTPTVYVETNGAVIGGYTSKSCELRASNGGVISGMDIGTGAYVFVRSGGVISGGTFNGAVLRIYENGIAQGVTITKAEVGESRNALIDGKMIDCSVAKGAQYRMMGGVAENLTVSGSGASFTASGGTISGVLIEDYAKLHVKTGAVVYDPVIRMNSASTIAGNYARINVSGLVEGGYTDGGNTLEIYMYDGGVIRNMTYNSGAYAAVSSGATVSGGLFNSGTTLAIRGGAVENVTMDSGAAISFNQHGGTVNGAELRSGARIYASSGAVVNDVSVLSGGSVYAYGNVGKINNMAVDQEAMLRLNLSGAVIENTVRDTAIFDTLENIHAVVDVRNAENDVTYLLADTGNSALQMTATYEGFAVDVNVDGTTAVNPFGQSYELAEQGKSLAVGAYTVTAAVSEAKSLLEEYDAINTGDRAVKWDGVAMTSGAVLAFADGTITGNGWVELNSVALDRGSVLYGADGDFGGTVNYLVRGTAGTIGNFAAGAAAGGSVEGVHAIVYDTDMAGVTYMGGFGNVGSIVEDEVVGGVETVVSSGASIGKDFYGGALANYAKTQTRTAISTINTRIATSITVEPEVEGDDPVTVYGEVDGNVYGASAVKAGTISTTATDAPLHTVGEVTLTLAAGEATNSKFCCFAGGYATGTDSAKAAAVYTVDSVTATVSGGSWGKVSGGRGIFGGIFASGVLAEAGEINLTVSGGTMGNVYGGGWSQKDGVSVVGDVNLTIRGTAEVANVFGGGTHSTSGGTTVAGNVTVTISGGTITGNVYARGQLEGDTVASSTVIFTGAEDFACNVYGYSYVGGDSSDATLEFRSYTGTLSGAVGGFDSVNFTGGTRMALTAEAASVSNTAWNFDFTERFDSFAETAALDWSTGAFGENSTVAVTFADAAQARAGWSIASVADAAQATFGVTVGDDVVATGLAYNTAIADGDYAGWGFTLDEGTLKFSKLA